MAVKLSLIQDDPLDDEAGVHWAVHETGSDHIVALLKEPELLYSATYGGDRVEHLVMEFCPLGDLQKLLSRQIAK